MLQSHAAEKTYALGEGPKNYYSTIKGMIVMKKSVKVLSFILATILCLSPLGISVTAAVFECEMVLTSYNTLENMMVSVTTKQAAGAVTGTLVFNSDLLNLDIENTVCHEEGVEVEDICTIVGNTITFIIVTDDLTNGSTQWIDFAFTTKGTGTATFSISDAQAADVGENLSNAIMVAPVTVNVNIGATEALGAQYRPATDANGNKAALRFGAKVYRTKDTNKMTVDGEEKTAIYCGFILGFEGNIKMANDGSLPELTANFDSATGKIESVTSGATVTKATKAYAFADEYLVHTIAVTGIGDTTTGTIGGVEGVLLKDAPIVARAYVVYKNADGSYGIAYADQISRTFRAVEESYSLVEG